MMCSISASSSAVCDNIRRIIMLWGIIIISSLVRHILCFQPEFAEPIVNNSVAIGRDATFTCHVRHLGGYRVGWVKADTKAIQAIHEHVITHNQRVSVSHSDQNTWNLHIKSVNEDDRGGYMCQLNTDPMKSQIGYLDVVIPPDFIPEDTSSDVIVPEGSSVKLTCRARGYPHPNVTWRREDGAELILKDQMGAKLLVPSYGGEILKLSKLSRSEMGSYLCIASNGVPPSVSKRISLSIHFHPVINVRNQLVGSPFEKDVTIECNVEASPKSINYWVKDTGTLPGEMIVSSSKYYLQEIFHSMYETHMSLTVKKFKKDDIGSYRCIAKNSLGEVDSSIRLYEIPEPKRNSYPTKHGTANDINKSASSSNNKRPPSIKQTAQNSPEDDEQFGSAEDYEDFERNNNNNNNYNYNYSPTRSSSHQDNNGGGGGGGSNINFNVPGGGSNGVRHGVNNGNNNNNIGDGGGGRSSNGIFGGINNNGGNVNRKQYPISEVRGSVDNEVSTAISSATTITPTIIINTTTKILLTAAFNYNYFNRFIIITILLLTMIFTQTL